MEILRGGYLERLRQFLDAPVITAVTGIRRAGKSVLLRQFAASLRDERQVVYVDKESFAFDELRTARDLVDYVEAHSRRAEPRVVIVDEVQQIAEWERAVASLNGEEYTQVVISGSNATLLSSELATLIAGRYVTLQVFPLTLREFGELYRQRAGAALSDADLFRLYLRIGGLPGLLHTDLSDRIVHQMLADMVSTIAIRDVIGRHRVRDVALLEAILRFAVDSAGSLVSAKRIADFMKSQRRKVAVDTVLNYLAHLGDAFLLAPVARFDLRGRRLLQVNQKYYLGDIGLRNGITGHRESDIGGVLENLVFLELRRRGYKVTVGVAGERKIDFVAERRSERWYVQVAYLLESPATIARELAAFAAVRDSYPRVLLSLDPHQPSDFEGVRHQSLTEFLRGAPLGTAGEHAAVLPSASQPGIRSGVSRNGRRSHRGDRSRQKSAMTRPTTLQKLEAVSGKTGDRADSGGRPLNSLWWNPGERRERRGARLTRRVREEPPPGELARVYFDRNATPSAAKRQFSRWGGGSAGMHRRSSPHRENWAIWVSPQAVNSLWWNSRERRGWRGPVLPVGVRLTRRMKEEYLVYFD